MKINEIVVGNIYQIAVPETGTHGSNEWAALIRNLPDDYWFPGGFPYKDKYKGSKHRIKCTPEMMAYLFSIQMSLEQFIALLRVAGGSFNVDGNQVYIIVKGQPNYIPPFGPWPEPPLMQGLTSVLQLVKVIGKKHDWVQIDCIPHNQIPPGHINPQSTPWLFNAPFRSLKVGSDEVGNAMHDQGVITPLWAKGEAWLAAEDLQLPVAPPVPPAPVPGEKKPKYQNFINALYDMLWEDFGIPEGEAYPYIRGAGMTHLAEPRENRDKVIEPIPD